MNVWQYKSSTQNNHERTWNQNCFFVTLHHWNILLKFVKMNFSKLNLDIFSSIWIILRKFELNHDEWTIIDPLFYDFIIEYKAR